MWNDRSFGERLPGALCGYVNDEDVALDLQCTSLNLFPSPIAATSNTLIGLPASSQQEVGADEDDFHAFKRVSNQLASEEKAERRKSEILGRQKVATTRVNPSSTLSILPRSNVPTRKKAKIVAF